MINIGLVDVMMSISVSFKYKRIPRYILLFSAHACLYLLSNLCSAGKADSFEATLPAVMPPPPSGHAITQKPLMSIPGVIACPNNGGTKQTSSAQSSSGSTQQGQNGTGSFSSPSGNSSADEEADGNEAPEDDPPKAQKCKYAPPDIPQYAVDMLVEAAEKGEVSTLELLIPKYRPPILERLSSTSGNSALHAAIQNDQDRSIMAIIEKARYLMPKLLHIKNRNGHKPLELLSDTLYIKDIIPDLRSYRDSFAPDKEYVQVKTVRKTLEELSFDPKKKQELPKPGDELLKKHKKKLGHYSSPTIQEASYGRHPCCAHTEFHHAMIPLHQCPHYGKTAYICESQLLLMLSELINDTQNPSNIHVNCPTCHQDINFQSILDNGIQALEHEKSGIAVPTGETVELLKELSSFFLNKRLLPRSYSECITSAGVDQCELCFDSAECLRFIHKPCAHRFCEECLTHYIVIASKNRDMLTNGYLSCPGEDCDVIVPDIVTLILTDEETLQRKDRIVLNIMVSNNDNLFMCLNPKCSHVVDISDMGCCGKIHCDQCHQASCIYCYLFPYHQGQTCEEYQSRFTASGAEKYFKAAKTKQANLYENCPNPNCKVEIYKESGCNYTTCNQCKKSFCWLCGKDLSREGYQHFQDSTNSCKVTGIKKQPWLQSAKVMEPEGSIYPAPSSEGYCGKCRKRSSKLNMWLCSHSFCPDCEMKMISDAANQNHDLDGCCLECNPIPATAVTHGRQQDEEKPLPPATILSKDYRMSHCQDCRIECRREDLLGKVCRPCYRYMRSSLPASSVNTPCFQAGSSTSSR